MTRTSILAAATLGAVVTLASANAQTGRPPTKVGTALDQPILGPSSSPGSVFAGLVPAVLEIKQYEFRPIAPGVFQLTATVVRAGATADSIMTGELDTTGNPWVFVEDTVTLQNIDTSGGFAGSMTPDLLVFAFDSGVAGRPQYSVRVSVDDAFPPPKDIGNLTGFVDSKLYRREGQDWFAYVAGNQILAVEIDRSRFAAGSDPRVGNPFVLVPFAGFSMHSQEVLLDNGADARALLLSANSGPSSRARPWFNAIVRAGIDNTEPPRPFHTGPNDTTWFANPGQLAGTTMYAVAPPNVPYGDPKQISLVASCGDAIPTTGGLLNLSAWLPYQEANGWAVTMMIGQPAPDLTIPGWKGKLALDLAGPLFVLPPQLWTGNDLSKDWLVPAPAALPGTHFWTQTVGFDPTAAFGAQWCLGNTAPVTWEPGICDFRVVPESQAVVFGVTPPDFYDRVILAPGGSLTVQADIVELTPPEDLTDPWVYGPGGDFVLRRCDTAGLYRAEFAQAGGYVLREINNNVLTKTTTVLVGAPIDEIKTKPTKTGEYKKFNPHAGDLVVTCTGDKAGENRTNYYKSKPGATVLDVSSVADAVTQICNHVANNNNTPLSKLTIAGHAEPGAISIGGGDSPAANQLVGKTGGNGKRGAYQALVDGLNSAGQNAKIAATGEICFIGCDPGGDDAGAAGNEGQNLVDCIANDVNCGARASKGSIYYAKRKGKWCGYAVDGGGYTSNQ